MPASIRPRVIVTCNFETFRIYDLDQELPEDHYIEVSLEELPDQLPLFDFLVSDDTSRMVKERELSIEAGTYVTRLYDALAAGYDNLETDPEEQRSLNVIVTRIVFLLYAEDADLLQSHDAFGKYCHGEVSTLRRRLDDLFKVLDQPENERDPYRDPSVLAFPYVDGGLFAEQNVRLPRIGEDVSIVIQKASEGFNWSGISPTIFGSVFESTLNPETRRSGGMHYTSIENIHKLIDPLFLNDIWKELHEAEAIASTAKRRTELGKLHSRIASMQVFDPACGSGNFLTESYMQLREVENRIIQAEQETARQTVLDLDTENPIRVSIGQFHGLEINDFAVSVAKTALWIAEEQMLEKTREIMPDHEFDFLPLTSNDGIREGNALRTDWKSIVPACDNMVLIGNPPFLGARSQNARQKSEVMDAFHGSKNSGELDYCSAWYAKAAEYTRGTHARCAFVSTNSICQGEQVAPIWEPLFKDGIHIDFAHRTFRWVNEASDMAHVFCVIVGFSREPVQPKLLYSYETPDSEAVESRHKHINAYLVAAPDAFVWARSKPLCAVPVMRGGNKPIDDGNYLFKEGEMEEFIQQEPDSAPFFHPWIGGDEFIKGKKRWVLWLGEVKPSELKRLPNCRERIAAVRSYRLGSKSTSTRKLAETPTRFHVELRPQGNSVAIPEVSSERRRFIPVSFVNPGVFCSNKMRLIPDATIFHFGVLQSTMHNAWVRVVTGRLKADYQYSSAIDYNTFVWPDPTQEQKQAIETYAQEVLDARAGYPDSTLADMYDPDNEWMFPDLMRAHKALDRAVEAAYGISFKGDEGKIVAHLFKLYAEKTGAQ